jgi:hypothetical protein
LGGEHGSGGMEEVWEKPEKSPRRWLRGRADYGSVRITRSSTKTAPSPKPCRLPCL